MKNLYLLLIFLFILSCVNPTKKEEKIPSSEAKEVIKIPKEKVEKPTTIATTKKEEHTFFKLEKTACSGDCPVYEVIINKKGKVTFIGKKGVLKEGVTEFQLTDKQFKKLQNDLAKRDFLSYKKFYANPNLPDLPSTIVTHKNKEIKIKLWKDVPLDLIKVTEYLDTILLTKKLYE